MSAPAERWVRLSMAQRSALRVLHEGGGTTPREATLNGLAARRLIEREHTGAPWRMTALGRDVLAAGDIHRQPRGARP